MASNRPEVLAEVRAVFARYEEALVGNDVAVLDELFLDSAETIRYGISENLYGIAAIRAFRNARPAQGLARTLEDTVITSYGDQMAIASTLFRRDEAPGKIGRQMQTWIRTATGWKVAAAHVSIIDAPA
ncbi:oxalurate catabolism protein HpxZ [Devosia sp.]|uniref:oxalurate catabolism protein HpxZ n=1 Tax=Devosia sp. TaxID=1871048 RepID=UPI003A921167